LPFGSPTENIDFDKYLFKKNQSKIDDFILADPVVVSLITDEEKNFKIKIAIQAGEFIYFSFSMIGIELGRLELSPDSIKIINRFEKTYYFGSFNQSAEFLNTEIDYYQLESLLLRGYVVNRKVKRIDFENNIEETNDFYIYSSTFGSGGAVKTSFEKETYKEKKIEISDEKYRLSLIIDLDYDKFGMKYPDEINVKFNSVNYQANLEIDIGKIINSGTLNRSFKVNSNYSEMHF